MRTGQRVTAKEIIEALVQAMHAGIEPLAYSALAPSIYQVYLHTDDHERLTPIFPRIAEEARQKLDEELARLNRGVLWGRLSKKSVVYENVQGGWHISFYENTDEDIEPGAFDVSITLALSPAPDVSGSPTKHVTLRRSHGETRKVRESVQRGRAASHEPPAGTGAATQPVHARLEYEDDSGRQTYQMTKSQIVIGRGGMDYWVDVKLHTSEDVSREHMRLRLEESTGKFYIKDLSTLGTTLDSRRVPTSIEVVGGERRDINVEVELPRRARIGLADVVHIEFVAGGGE